MFGGHTNPTFHLNSVIIDEKSDIVHLKQSANFNKQFSFTSPYKIKRRRRIPKAREEETKKRRRRINEKNQNK